MADVSRLARWTFTSFHVAVLVVLGIALGHVFGSLSNALASLRTSLGFGLYLLLWGLTWWTNGRWLATSDPWPLQPNDWTSVIASGTNWGAITGMALFAVLLILLVAVLLPSPEFVIIVIPAGTIVAAAIGGFVGGLLATIDVVLVALARRVRR